MTWDPYCTPPEVTPIDGLRQPNQNLVVTNQSTLLSFSDRTRTGVLKVICSSLVRFHLKYVVFGATAFRMMSA